VKPINDFIIPPTMVVRFPPSSYATENKEKATCWTNEEKHIIPVDFVVC